MGKVFRAAVIGCGEIAQKKHLPLIQADPCMKIKMLYSKSGDAAVRCKSKFGDKHTVVAESVDAILNAEDIDIVFICSPNNTHARYAIAALRNGKHVICEKPMAISASEAEEMVKVSKEQRKVLHISYQNRYTSNAIYLKALCDQGIINDVYYARAYAIRRRGFPTWGAFGDTQIQGGGPLIDIASHSINLVLAMCGEIKPLYASGCTFSDIARCGSQANIWGNWDCHRVDTEDCAVGMVVMENGMALHVEASYALNDSEEKEAAIDLFSKDIGVKLRENDGVTIVKELGGQMCIASNHIQRTWRSVPALSDRLTPYELEHRDYMEKIVNHHPYERDLEQALNTTRIIDALYKSARERKPAFFK